MSSGPAPPAGRAARVGLAVALLAALAVPLAARVGVDNRIELWVASGSEAAERHARFRDDFGSDEFVLVAYAGGDWLSPASLAAQDEALASLEALPHVRRVAGAPAVRRDLLADPDDREALRRELLATPFYRGFLVAEDGGAAGLLVETALPADPAARAALVHGVRAAVAPLERAGHEVAVVGPPVLNVALDELSRREGARTFPLAFVASLVLVGLAFRSWRAAAVAGACAGSGLLLTLGVVGASGRSLNLVTAVLPSLLWVLTLAGAVHLLARERAHRALGDAPGPALDAALREVAGPCAMAAVTTSLGFLSLLAADLRPVRELGAFAAIGVLLGLGVTLTLGPALLAKLPPRDEPTSLPGRRALVGLGALATRRPRLVLTGAAVAVVAVAASLPRLHVESDPLAFLPADSTTVRDYRSVARNLTGFYSLEVVVDTPGHWLDPAAWPALDGVSRALEAAPGVRRVLSPLDLLRHLHALGRGRDPGAYALPADRAEARRLLDLFDAFGDGERSRLVAAGGARVRLSALIDVMPSGAFLAVVGAAERALAALPPPYTGHATGIVLRLVDAQLDLVTSQLRSFGLAFATVFACLAAGLRSARLVAVAVLPNLLPVASAFAAMVALGIALDAATVMMASVALGIAVDDTVHLLSAFRRALPRASSRAEAARAALLETGPAMAVTTAAACIGFAALLGSSFAPIRWFGLLASLALGVALLADILVAPATLTTRLGGPLP